MNGSDSREPSTARDAIEVAIRRNVAARLKFWGLAIGLPSLFLLANIILLLAFQTRQVIKLTREVQTLRAEALRFGTAVEIYNPAWGTVIDGVDPARLPSRDARDPRHGALIQQYTPRGNAAQIWQLRPASSPPERDVPLSAEAYIKHGFSFLSARDFNKAVTAFEHCLERYPDASGAHSGLGRAYRDKGDFARALASHARAIELEPGRADYRWESAVTQLRAGDLDHAISDCEAALKQNPDFGDAHNTLGMVYRSKANYTEALKQHDRALELNPLREDFWRERAATHQASGNQQKATEDLARARETQSGRR